MLGAMELSATTVWSGQAARAALDWLAEMGADAVLETTPQRYDHAQAAEPAAAAPAASRPVIAAEPAPALLSVVEEATKRAAVAETLAALAEAIRAFEGCALKKMATHTVIGDGAAESGILVIGEAPGADEDRQGIPFCGASGQLLDKMLRAIGLTRDAHYYITNMLYWRPPGNRQPTAQELAICRPFVERMIALLSPRVLVLVGGTAASALLGDARGITRLRGREHAVQVPGLPSPIPAHVLYHPSYLLRQPLAKRQAWADLLALKARIGAQTAEN